MKKERLWDRIKEGLLSSFYIMKKEFGNVFRDEGVLIFFFLVPLAYPLVYSFIYMNQTVHEVKVVAVDMSSSVESREFLRRADGAPDLHIVAAANSIDEAKEYLRRKKAYGIIYVPEDFSKQFATGNQANVSLFADMSSLLFYKAMLLTLTDVSLDMGKEIQVSNFKNLTQRQDNTTAMPIENVSVAIFNPTSGFANFLIPAVLVLIIQQTLLLGIGMLAGTARDRNAFKDLIPVDRHYRGTMRVIIGKALCYLITYVIITFYILWLVPALFSLTQIGRSIDIFLFILPYLLACIFFAMTLSTIMRGRESPMLVFVFTSVPLLFISGVSWPEVSVPEFWKVFGWIFPSSHGIQGFIKINTMGATLNEVTREYTALWILTGLYAVTTYVTYQWQIRRHRRNMSKNDLIAEE